MLSRRAAWAVALVAMFTMTVSYVDRSTLSALAPSVTKALGISETAYGWLGSAFSIAYLVGTPLAGWWIDRVGARRGLTVSVVVWTCVAALHAFAPSFAVLFALRIALGLAEAPSFPGAAQTLQRVLPPAERERGFGVLFTGSSIGAMLTPLLASALFAYAGWRFAFMGSAIAGLVWIPLWITVTRRARAQLDAPPPTAGSQAPTAGSPANNKTAKRVPLLTLLAHPVTLRALVAVLAAAPIAGFAYVWGAKFLNREFGVVQADVGHYLWLPPLMFDLGCVLFGDLASRQRRPAGVAPRGLFALAVPCGAAIALMPWMGSPWAAMTMLGVGMIGCGGMYTLVTADLLARVPASSVSFAGGLLAASQSLVLIIVNPLIGWSVDTHHDYNLVAWTLGAWVMPGALAWLVWRPRQFSQA